LAEEPKTGCVSKAGGPVKKPMLAAGRENEPKTEEKKNMGVMVGQEAPDFEASAYYQGGFKNVRLSEFRGKWVFLCFYPGDFTFV